jgi:hypothetical protein
MFSSFLNGIKNQKKNSRLIKKNNKVFIIRFFLIKLNLKYNINNLSNSYILGKRFYCK